MLFWMFSMMLMDICNSSSVLLGGDGSSDELSTFLKDPEEEEEEVSFLVEVDEPVDDELLEVPVDFLATEALVEVPADFFATEAPVEVPAEFVVEGAGTVELDNLFLFIMGVNFWTPEMSCDVCIKDGDLSDEVDDGDDDDDGDPGDLGWFCEHIFSNNWNYLKKKFKSKKKILNIT